MLAVMNSHFTVAQLLVEHGAQVDGADKSFHTPLHAAVSCVLPILQFHNGNIMTVILCHVMACY